MNCRLSLLLFLALTCCKNEIPSVSGFFQSGSNALYYEVHGKGEPIVFIHGGGVDLHMWRPQVNELSKDFRVITYDLRGHGESEKADNSLTELADVVSLLNHLGLEKANIVGLSLGAIIALDLALAYPDKVDKLALLSPGLAGFQEQDTSYLMPIIELGTALQKQDLNTAIDIVEKITFHGSGKRQLPAEMDTTVAYVRDSFAHHILRKNETRIPQFAELQPVTRLSEIKCPVLLIEGAEDAPYTHRNVEKLSTDIENARVHVIDNAAHLLNAEKPKRVNQLLRDFINQ